MESEPNVFCARPFNQIQALSIFPSTSGEWPNCDICWRSCLPLLLGRSRLMWSPTSLDFFQERTEWCVWSVVGKASRGMWLGEDHVGPARGSSLSQEKGFSSWGCGKVRGQMYPVPTLSQNPQLMLQLCPETPQGSGGNNWPHNWNYYPHWDCHRESYERCMGFTPSSWLEMCYLNRWVISSQVRLGVKLQTKCASVQDTLCMSVMHSVLCVCPFPVFNVSLL